MNTTELAQSLPAALASVPDPRGLRGRRHPLPAILTLAVCAIRGPQPLRDSSWGRQQDAATVQAMGFTRPRTPAVGPSYRIPSAGRGRLRDRSGRVETAGGERHCGGRVDSRPRCPGCALICSRIQRTGGTDNGPAMTALGG